MPLNDLKKIVLAIPPCKMVKGVELNSFDY